MKKYLKNVATYTAYLYLFLLIWALLELTMAALQDQTGIPKAGICPAILTVAIIAGAVKTLRDRRMEERENGIDATLLDAMIQSWREELAKIEEAGPNAGKEERRIICKITLAALEEKRDRVIKGKKRRADHESHTCKR